MDSPQKPFTAVEWCAGYAGIHLGLKRTIPNLRVIAFSEIEAFACANLVAKMEAGLLEPAPIWPNLKTFPSAAFANKVDLLVAGYPCQPFSAAGKRLGTEDERHLWPHIAAGIKLMRPRFCFFENVEGHITLGLSTVISDLAEMGYKTTWGIFSAIEVGAPHQRKRVFILGHREHNGLHGLPDTGGGSKSGDRFAEGEAEASQLEGAGRPADGGYLQRTELAYEGEGSERSKRGEVWPSRPGEPQYDWEPPRIVGDAQCHGHTSTEVSRSTEEEQTERWMQGGCGLQGGAEGERQTQSPLGGNTHGTTDRLDYAELYESCNNRVDELRLLGNGVVPTTAARAWEVLWARLNNC